MDLFDFDDEDDEAQLDLTPLIDVVFLLLIFFIMATSFTKPVIDIILPESTSAVKNTRKQEELIISITADGTIYYENAIITKDSLATLLDTYPNKYLNIHVDKATPFEAFLHVVDYAKIKRNGEFIITTKEKK